MIDFNSSFRANGLTKFEKILSRIIKASASLLILIFTGCSINDGIVEEYKRIIRMNDVEFSATRMHCAIKIYSVSDDFELKVSDRKIFNTGNTYGDDMSHLLLNARDCLEEGASFAEYDERKRNFYKHVNNANVLHRYHPDEGVLVVYSPYYSKIYFLRGDWD